MEATREIWFREVAVGCIGTKIILVSGKGVVAYSGVTTGNLIKQVLRWESHGVGHFAIMERT